MMTIFLDGRLLKVEEPFVAALDPGRVAGEGVFETMRWRGGWIFGLDKHFDRMERGLKRYHIPPSYPRRQWKSMLGRTVQANHCKNARVRLSVWREGGKVRTAVVSRDWQGYPRAWYREGIKAGFSTIPRKLTRVSDIKSLDYSCFREALAEARKKGWEEAVLVNTRQEVVEGSRTNIFLVREGVLWTPSVRCGCLNGVTRQAVIAMARALGIPCKTGVVGRRDLARADEVFVTNALMGVMPVTTLDDRIIGNGRPGPVTRNCSRAYRANEHFPCPSSGKSV